MLCGSFVEYAAKWMDDVAVAKLQPHKTKGIAHLLMTDMVMRSPESLLKKHHDRDTESWTVGFLNALCPLADGLPTTHVTWGMELHNALADGEYVFQTINHALSIDVGNRELLDEQQQTVSRMCRHE